ncbi:MAG: alanine racemase [Negativicutes bacterium]|nr:alanine racemase [Negativicutes bacterium]
MRPTQAIIDLKAIRHNIRALAAGLRGANFTAVVKANAYGHGAVEVSKAALAAGASSLAVAIPEEGIELREAGIAVPIFLLGLILPEQADIVVKHRLIAPVATREGASALSAEALRQGRRAYVMLKTDTGMGRIGLRPADVQAFAAEISRLPAIELMGLFTHLATADAADKTYANEQLAIFQRVADTLLKAGINLPYISAANSAVILDLPAGHCNLVRAGIAMYGLPPSDEMHNVPALRPAMTLKTRIVFIKHVPAGTKIGYGSTYTTPEDTYIATLPVGYADGYSRRLSNKAEVLIGGKRRRIVGRVCMDQTMVDLGPVCDAEVGDEAVLFGRQGKAEITVTELAAIAGTINYELVCAVSARVPRVYVNEK